MTVDELCEHLELLNERAARLDADRRQVEDALPSAKPAEREKLASRWHSLRGASDLNSAETRATAQQIYRLRVEAASDEANRLESEARAAHQAATAARKMMNAGKEMLRHLRLQRKSSQDVETVGKLIEQAAQCERLTASAAHAKTVAQAAQRKLDLARQRLAEVENDKSR
ncbi:MAG: hypothetical protein AB1453_04450 [Chloroflexota bacterium]